MVARRRLCNDEIEHDNTCRKDNQNQAEPENVVLDRVEHETAFDHCIIAQGYAEDPNYLSYKHSREFVFFVHGDRINLHLIVLVQWSLCYSTCQPPSFRIRLINSQLNNRKDLAHYDQQNGKKEHKSAQVHHDLAYEHDDGRERWKDPQEEKGLENDHHDQDDHHDFANDVFWFQGYLQDYVRD